MSEEKKKVSFTSKLITIISGLSTLAKLLIAVAVLVVVVLVGYKVNEVLSPKPVEQFNTSSLEEIIDVSELSTFVAVYNGVAIKYDDKNDEKVDYYTYYEASVKVGIDFTEIKYENLKEERIIKVTLPPITITDTDVDISTLEFMFIDAKSETDTVVEQAYNLCYDDLKEEVKKEFAIIELGEQNAIKTIEALIIPFANEFGNDYSIEVGFMEDNHEEN